MKKFGLIGYPIAKSGSPALFRAGYGGRYSYDLIEEPDFATAFDRFVAGYDGINVTAPFKIDAFRKADIRTGICTRTGAANLLLKTDNGIMADNTDYAGIVLSVMDALLPDGGYGFYRAHGTDFSTVPGLLRGIYGHRPKALVAGCGGAGRAAAAAAAEMGYETVLANRTADKAARICGDMPEYGFSTAPLHDFPDLVKSCALVIYTIPERIPEIDLTGADCYAGKGKIILEANYKTPSFGKLETGTMEQAGCRYVTGRRWLLYQALTGFSIFTGETPDFEKMSSGV